MILDRLLGKRSEKIAGLALYAAAAAQARTVAFYRDHGVPDTREGRFELYCLHVILLVERLKGQGREASRTSQALFDAFARGLDDAFRELGVGDLTVPKRMKALGEAFYGRLKGYDEAFAALPDTAPLAALVERTVLDRAQAPATGDPATFVLTRYILANREGLAAMAIEDLVAGRVFWTSL